MNQRHYCTLRYKIEITNVVYLLFYGRTMFFQCHGEVSECLNCIDNPKLIKPTLNSHFSIQGLHCFFKAYILVLQERWMMKYDKSMVRKKLGNIRVMLSHIWNISNFIVLNLYCISPLKTINSTNQENSTNLH